MTFVNSIFNAAFDLIMVPFRMENPWPGLVAVALITSIVVLLIFRVASKPKAVRRSRDRLLARVLELVLFKDDLVVNLGAFGRVLVANAQYVGTLIVPMVFSMVPVALILVQTYVWFGLRPLLPGEAALLTVQFSPSTSPLQQEATLDTSTDLKVESMPVRVPSRNEVSWRIRVGDGASGWVDVTTGGQTTRKDIVVGRTLAAVSSQRSAGGFWESLIHPREHPLPSGSSFERLAVTYPARTIQVCGKSVNWLLAFLVLTMAFGLILKKPLGVEL